MEFATPETAEVVSGGRSFGSAAKNVGRQTLRKQLGSCSKVENNILMKTIKHASRSLRDVFTNICHQSCPTSFGIELLWQFLETLKGKSQLLTMCCPPT